MVERFNEVSQNQRTQLSDDVEEPMWICGELSVPSARAAPGALENGLPPTFRLVFRFIEGIHEMQRPVLFD